VVIATRAITAKIIANVLKLNDRFTVFLFAR
jgi:hypothetical protein